MSDAELSRSSGRWTWLRAAGACVGLESVAYGVAGIAYAVHAVSLDKPMIAWGLAVMALLAAAALGALALAFWRGRSWPATASVTWQALQVLAGLSMLSDRPLLAIALIVVGVAAGVCSAMVRRDALTLLED